VGVLLICVRVFTVFCIVCNVFLYCFVYVYLFLFVLSVLVWGLLPPSDNLKLVIIIIIIIIIIIMHNTEGNRNYSSVQYIQLTDKPC
jgi:hypothetical protein